MSYGEQNGDLMRDPEMCFEHGFIDGQHLSVFYTRFAYVAVSLASHDVQVYTSDAIGLANTLGRNISKASAIEPAISQEAITI